jgi:uncharacterized ubiquitin-like protein YukD
MKLVVIDELSEPRKTYLLKISEEATAKDIIDLLIRDGSIKPAPREGYQWILTDSKGIMFTLNEKISSRFPQISGGYEVFYEVHLISRPIMTKLIVTVIDKVYRRMYKLEIFEENTAKDVIDTLIAEGLIKPVPMEGYQWILTDSNDDRIISSNEKLSSRFSPEKGVYEVFLTIRPVGEERNKLIVIDRLSGKKYELEGFEESTAQEVIDDLIDVGFIRPSPGERFEWVLLDSKLKQILPNEKLSSRLSPGENEVYLVACVYAII